LFGEPAQFHNKLYAACGEGTSLVICTLFIASSYQHLAAAAPVLFVFVSLPTSPPRPVGNFSFTFQVVRQPVTTVCALALVSQKGIARPRKDFMSLAGMVCHVFGSCSLKIDRFTQIPVARSLSCAEYCHRYCGILSAD